jgi:hypothetical protein
MDSTVTPEPGDTDTGNDIPVHLDSLTIDGVRPETGDLVNLRVKGPVTKIVDQVVWVKPETVNDLPLVQDVPQVSDEEELMAAAAKADALPVGY